LIIGARPSGRFNVPNESSLNISNTSPLREVKRAKARAPFNQAPPDFFAALGRKT
jgi:hypothetical protein